MALPDQAQAGSRHPAIAKMSHLGLEETHRCKLLDSYSAFAEGTQHDHHQLDWNGGKRAAGTDYMLERLAGQGWTTAAAQDSAHAARKPDAHPPLAQQVVNRFTEMLLSAGRRPSLVCHSDPATSAYLDAVFGAAGLWETLTQARDISGACGSALVVCELRKGRPASEALHPKHCWVPEWSEDGAGRWRPRVVVEQLIAHAEYRDEETGKIKTGRVWCTRAWDEQAHYVWPDVSEKDAKDPDFVWPEPEVWPHGLGVCPVVWMQNTRKDREPDGHPDCKGVWHLLDKIDRLWSQVCKAVVANIDPSLVVKEEERTRRKAMVLRKGKAMGVSPNGDIKYLEMQGTGVQTALTVIGELTQLVLQIVECVVIRQEDASVYQSGEALQILWRSMESKANRLRATLETTIRDLCELWLIWGRKAGVGNLDEPGGSGILLPPRRIDEPMDADDMDELDDMPVATPGIETTWETHTVGEGRWVSITWPQYWNPTAAQMQTVLTSLTSAVGTEPVLSVESAVRHAATYVGTTGDEEMERMRREQAARDARAGAGAFMQLTPGPEDGEDEGGELTEEGGEGSGEEGGEASEAGEASPVAKPKSKTRGLKKVKPNKAQRPITNDEPYERK